MREQAETQDRLSREREFHDHSYATQARARLAGYYRVLGRCVEHFDRKVMHACKGRAILEIGCGVGAHAAMLARNGATVVAIDISDVAVEQAAAAAKREGLGIHYEVMNAEETRFPDGRFDVICGSGILHHLDLRRAYEELARILKPGGRAVFMEPLGHNPLINLYRHLTPSLRSADEHPLLMSDLTLADKFFNHTDITFHCLFSLVAVWLQRTALFKPALGFLDRVDEQVFRVLPSARRFAWYSVLVFERPRVRGLDPG